MKKSQGEVEKRWAANRALLAQWWSTVSRTEFSGPERESIQARTLVFVPSVSLAEYLRLDLESFSALQNMMISGLYQLADPSVTLIYVCPKYLTSNEILYHEKLLSLLGISLLPKRLYFVTPELVEKLPSHLSLSLALLCSSLALRKIAQIIAHHRSTAVLVPCAVSWTERRLCHLLNIPLLAAEPTVSESLSSRSFAKKIFEDVEVNVPIGAHDIFNLDDLLVALSKLMSSNIFVKRWLFRLNYDYNNESCVFLEADKMSIVGALRREYTEMAETGGAGWFTRQVQLSVRKRLLAYLKSDLAGKIRICRRDIYADWDAYLRLLRQYGAVIEAEPLEVVGWVNGLCFVDPLGNVEIVGGVELYLDRNLQVQAVHGPQRVTPQAALDGATVAVARSLFEKYGVIGYVTVKFQSYWDALDNIPRYLRKDPALAS
jgi:hypothetical protein